MPKRLQALQGGSGIPHSFLTIDLRSASLSFSLVSVLAVLLGEWVVIHSDFLSAKLSRVASGIVPVVLGPWSWSLVAHLARAILPKKHPNDCDLKRARTSGG